MKIKKLRVISSNSVLLILIILLFLIFASFSLKKPFVLDEIISVNIVQNISEGGAPVGYWGEDLTYYMPAIHTTLAFYLLSIGYIIFDYKEVGTRIIPMIFCIGAIILVYLISKQIFRRNKNVKKIALTSSLLFALSPLVIQVSTLVTLDMILLFFVVLFIYIFIRSYKDKLCSISTLVLILLTAIILWCKFANIPTLFLALFLYGIIDKKPKGVLKIFIIGLFGSLLFAGTWYIYTKSVGVPFLNFLISNANYAGGNKIVSLFTLENILLRLWTIKSIVFWTTPYFLIIVIFAFVSRVREYIKEKNINFLDFFIIFSCLIVIQYLILYPSAYGFPKHFVAMVPGFSVLIAYYISKFRLKDLVSNKKLLYVLLAAVILVTVFNFIFLKDPFIEHNIFYSKSITLQDDFDEYLISNLKGILFFVPFAIIFFVFYPILRKGRYSTYYITVVSMFITIIVLSIYVDYVQANADYSTKWGYGEKGILETSKYIKEHTTKDDLIISRGCIGYYAQRRYYMSYPNPNPGIKIHTSFKDVELVDYPNNINNLIENKVVPYVILSNLEKGIHPEPGYYPVAKYGSFTIYRLRE